MTLSRILAAAALAAFSLSPAFAADAKGCRDLAGLKRFEASELAACDGRNFAEYRLPTGAASAYDHNSKRGTFASQVDLEGRLARTLYVVPKGPSSAEVFRNYRTELAEKGFATLYEGRGGELGYWMPKVAPARLRPAGVGLLAPVASNETEDGRAKNRRVELLPQ